MENPIQLLHPYNRTEENLFLLHQWNNNHSKENIPPSYEFAKESLVQNPVMKWIENFQFILVSKKVPAELYGTLVEQVPNLMDWLKSKKCQFKFFIDNAEKDVIALDLETTGLNGSVQFYGGQVKRNEDIIGICISFDEFTGYYIPVGNTEEDYIPNYSMDEALEFIQALNQPNYHNVLHNAMYDLNIMRNHGVNICNMFSDTMLISKLMNNFEFFPLYVQNGLKGLSAHVLQRKAIELKEMFGAKEEIQFNRLSATTATVYGGMDSLNTIGLFKAFVLDDKFGRNPYKYQASNTYIVHRYVYHLIAQSTCGMPIDYENAEITVKTCIRRMILLERKWEKIVSENSPVPLSLNSAEQTNIFVGDLLRKNFFGEADQFPSWALETFAMSVKSVMVAVGKKDERLKTTYGMDDSVIQNIEKKLRNMSYSDKVKKVVLDSLKIVSMYRSLAHEVPMYIGLLRCAFRDDRGITIGNFSVKPEGTDCLVAGTPIKIKIDNFSPIDISIEQLSELCEDKVDVTVEGEYKLISGIKIECGVNKFVEITHFVIKKKPILEVQTDRVAFGCAVKHRVTNDRKEWVTCDSLKSGDKIKTVYGFDTVEYITFQPNEELTYDVVTNHPITKDKNKRPYHYVALGIYHHNTGRNASAKGTGVHRIQNFSTSKAGVVKVKMTRGNGDIIGVNSQGMSSTPFKLEKAKKVDMSKMPLPLLEKIEELNKDVEVRYTDLMMAI